MGVIRSSAYVPWPLAWCVVGLLTVGMGESLTLLSTLRTLCYWVALFSLRMRVLALTYCIWFCSVWLSSLRSLVFSEEETEGEWILGEKRDKRVWKK